MQLKELANNAESGSEISKMIQEKSREWYATLEPQQKQMLIDDNMGHIVDELLNIYDNPTKTKETKKCMLKNKNVLEMISNNYLKI